MITIDLVKILQQINTILRIMKSNYESFYQKIQVRPDEALVLSNCQKLQFPNPTEIKPNLLSSLVSNFMPSSKNSPQDIKKCFIPIPNQLFLMSFGNAIVLYRHWQTDNQQLECQLQTEIQLSYNIKTIKLSHFSKCKKGKAFYFIVEDISSNFLQLMQYDPGENVIKRLKMQKIQSQIYCWSFIENYQILVWCQNMKIYHYEIKLNGLKFIQALDSGVNINQEKLNKVQKKTARSKSKDKKQMNEHGQQKQKAKNKKIQFTLNFCSIVGHRSKEQDTIIVLFYVLYNEESNGMKIKCKQIHYPLQNQQIDSYYNFLKNSNEFPKLKMNQQAHQIISNNTANPEVPQTLNIVQVEDVFLVLFQFEIIAIQKKFNQYLAVDNIYKKTKDCIVSMAFNSNIVSCISNKILQLNEIQITENRVHTNMVDFIDLETEYDNLKNQISKEHKQELASNLKKIKKMLSKENKKQEIKKEPQESDTLDFDHLKQKSRLFCMWISTDLLHQQHRNNVYFVFEIPIIQNGVQKKQYILYLTRHMPRIKKLTNLAHKAKQIGDIQNIQKLGHSLGVDSSEFYFNMWKTSEQTSQDIIIYLLKCKNYKKILIELKSFLRKKSYVATKLLRVIQKLESLTLQIVKQQLTEQFIIDYFHVLFLHRKFQMFDSNYQIDERQFTAMVEISLYQLIRKIITQQLFPDKKKLTLWMVEPKQPPKFNLMQVLDLFKLPLLQQYDVFLRNILKQYPNNIIEVIDNFPQLLPEYPFIINKIDLKGSIKIQQPLRPTQSRRQRQFFSQIKIEHLKNQPNFLSNALSQLYPYYSTSLIVKSFDLILKRPQILNQKYYYHSIIQLEFDKYSQAVQKITGTRLYIVALDCLVRANSKNEQGSQKLIHELCSIFKKHHNISEDVLCELQVIACLYELMIKHSIIQSEQISLEEVYSEPIQKWIALFFLGNKQQKDLIFTQFMDIFQDRNHFVETLKKFIASEHCSKIQLSFLIDLITHMDQQFQRENQNIIDVIIDGFCSKVQISDTPDANHFKQRLRSVQMGQQLLIKADKIEKMNVCKRIFSIFYMQNILLKDLLYKTKQVLQQMLQNFFKGRIKQSKIAISQKNFLQIETKLIKNMFELLRYLRENVLFNVSAEQLVILYCKKLIEWQEFDQVHDFLYNQEYLEMYDLNQEEIIQKIQFKILQQLYEDENAYYDENTKLFINNIINLQRKHQRNPLVIQEKAKMAIVQIFQSWGYDTRLTLLNSMCKKWEEFQQQQNCQAAYGTIYCRPIMTSIIQTYAEFLDVKSLQQIYKNFMIAHFCKENPETKTIQFYHYCTKLGDSLMALGRLKQASQIICIVNQRFEMNFSLMSECLLKSLNYIYFQQHADLESDIKIREQNSQKSINFETPSSKPQEKRIYNRFNMFGFTPIIKPQNDEQISVLSEEIEQVEQVEIDPMMTAKKYIDYFVHNWIQGIEEQLNQMFKSFFSAHHKIAQITEIQVSPDLCFKQHHHKIKNFDLWMITQRICKQIQNVDRQTFIYCYFFMLMGLASPEEGFSQIDYISYKHPVLIILLNKFKDVCDKEERMLFIDYSVIFQKYLDALTTLLIERQQQENSNDETNESKKKIDMSISKQQNQEFSRIQSKPNLTVVRDLVKKGEYKSDPLAQLINKMAGLTLQAQRNAKRRLIQYSNYISIKKFDLSVSLRSKNKKNLRSNQKAAQMIQIAPTIHQQKSQSDRPMMMSFDQFKKLKNKIKNDQSLSLGTDLDITQRVIVEQIFGKIDSEAAKKFEGTRKQIPGLSDLIETSLKQIEQKEKQNKQKKQNEGQNERAKQKQGDKIIQNKGTKKQYCQDEQILCQAIKQQNYAAINNWSPDAIYLETAKIYKNRQIKFPMVIKMFHELCVGDHTKVDVLWISEPEHLKIDNQVLKKIFSIEYLKAQFGSYAQFQSEMLNKMYTVIEQLTATEIHELALYLNDMTKVQYKKASRNSWINMLGMTAIAKQAQNQRSLQTKIKRLQTLFAVLSPQFLQKQIMNILNMFQVQGAMDVLDYLKQKFKTNLDN